MILMNKTYSLLPNVTTGWFIWKIFTKIASQQTCVMCETNFVKISFMNQLVVCYIRQQRVLNLSNLRQQVGQAFFTAFRREKQHKNDMTYKLSCEKRAGSLKS